MVFLCSFSTPIINFPFSEAGWSSWGQQQAAQPPPVATPAAAISPVAASPSRAPSSTPSIAASEPPNGTLKKVKFSKKIYRARPLMIAIIVLLRTK